jgi:periplasmic copper chaperone A
MSKTRGLTLGATLMYWAVGAWGASALTIQDPYALAVPRGQPNSAVFMRIVNDGDAPRTVVGGESGAAAAVELHVHTMEGGMMKMRRVERFEVPPHGSLTLEPGGLHLMLIGLKQDLAPGDHVDFTLVLDDGPAVQVHAPVRDLKPAESGGR